MQKIFYPIISLCAAFVIDILIYTVTSIICHSALENESQILSMLFALCEIDCQSTNLKVALKSDQFALAKLNCTIRFIEGVSLYLLILRKTRSMVKRSNSIAL